MEIVRIRITKQDLIDTYSTSYPGRTKAVVDLGRGIMAVDAEWHADLELLLLEDGSLQKDLWGINFLPHEKPENFIQYESLINIRPAHNNYSIEIESQWLRDRIKRVVDSLIDYSKGNAVEEPGATYGAELSAEEITAFGGTTRYPCFKHHKQLTLDKWRSFEAWKRVLMIANEFGRAKTFLKSGNIDALMGCYECALELFHITVEAGRMEGISPAIIAGLLRLRERTAGLLAGRKNDEGENQRIREELIRLDPQGYRLFQRPTVIESSANVPQP